MHRPTFNPAIGGTGQGGGRTHAPSHAKSVRDILGDSSLKKRHYEKALVEDKEVLRQKLEAKEMEAKQPSAFKKGKTDDSVQVKIEGVLDADAQRKQLAWLQETNPDAADSSSSSASESSSDSSSDSDDDDDGNEEAELLKELEKIKRERAEEQQRKLAAQREEEEMQKRQAALHSNPLLVDGNQTVTKKWFEDTVFRNQAKKEKQEKKRFINSVLHSDFHRSFLDRFVK